MLFCYENLEWGGGNGESAEVILERPMIRGLPPESVFCDSRVPIPDSRGREAAT